MKRDLYIDFAKGLATLSIIFIHTAFGVVNFIFLRSENIEFTHRCSCIFCFKWFNFWNNVEKPCTDFETSSYLYDFCDVLFF